jgi:ABC-type antimicrobial peptide transport system ATPase subunit
VSGDRVIIAALPQLEPLRRQAHGDQALLLCHSFSSFASWFDSFAVIFTGADVLRHRAHAIVEPDHFNTSFRSQSMRERTLVLNSVFTHA